MVDCEGNIIEISSRPIKIVSSSFEKSTPTLEEYLNKGWEISSLNTTDSRVEIIIQRKIKLNKEITTLLSLIRTYFNSHEINKEYFLEEVKIYSQEKIDTKNFSKLNCELLDLIISLETAIYKRLENKEIAKIIDKFKKYITL